MPSKRQNTSARAVRLFLAMVGLLCVTSLASFVLGDARRAGASTAGMDAYQPLDVQPAEVHLEPSTASFTCRQDLTVQVHHVQHLAGIMYQIIFDPDALQVVDADPGRRGVQIHTGEMLQGHSYVEQANVADNATGVITYSAALLGDNVSGWGSLGRITFEPKAPGIGVVDFNRDPQRTGLSRDPSTGSPYDPLEIPTTWYSATLTVTGECTDLFLPLVVNEYG